MLRMLRCPHLGCTDNIPEGEPGWAHARDVSLHVLCLAANNDGCSACNDAVQAPLTAVIVSAAEVYAQ